jgi:hypothetical protein
MEDSGLDAWFADFVGALSDTAPRLPGVPITIPAPLIAPAEREVGTASNR